MRRLLARAALATALALSAALADVARAGDIAILSGGAAKAGLADAIPLYEKQAGTKAAIEYLPMGPLMKRLGEGAAPDVVVLTEEVMTKALADGLVVAGTQTEVGRVEIGVAVHESARLPDISTPDAFKAAVVAAKSLVWIDPKTGTSGKHLAEVFARLGILEEVTRKTTFGTGGYVPEPVGRGEIEMGLHQITEILPVKGLKLVGPLPAALQKVTIYIGAVTTKAKDGDAARRFLASLRNPEARAAFQRRGFSG